MYSCGEGVNLIGLNILAGDGLSMFKDLGAKAQGDNSFGVNERNLRGFRYGRFVISGVRHCHLADWGHCQCANRE